MELHKSIISQYKVEHFNDLPTTTALLCQHVAEQNDITTDWQNFYRIAFNINSSQGIWLDYWGIWVGIGRYVNAPSDGTVWGVAPDSGTFNSSVFFNPDNNAYTQRLSDSAYRRLILLKAFSNISDCSIPTLNKALLYFFDGRRAYAIDNFDMSITINVEFELSSVEYTILVYSNAFPKCAGVLYNYTFFTSGNFGVASDSGTLDNAVFWH